ncbi:hypothetical protein O3M35_003670 [Rhynocoris fuscipes]|uniref:Uncharacterized protein n=1 Tax=Rhynocoris fuscipes TaxID=488301 RepID=A0AAW1CSD5_9HEMI
MLMRMVLLYSGVSARDLECQCLLAISAVFPAGLQLESLICFSSYTENAQRFQTPLISFHRSAYTPKANQQLRLLSPEWHGVSKCKFTCPLAGIEPVIALVNARIKVHEQKSTTLTTQPPMISYSSGP